MVQKSESIGKSLLINAKIQQILKLTPAGFVALVYKLNVGIVKIFNVNKLTFLHCSNVYYIVILILKKITHYNLNQHQGIMIIL